MKPVIVTGGPGAGKTTLIQALTEQGFVTYPEVSRQLIEHQSLLDDGVLPWIDLPAFAQLCLTAMNRQKQQASDHEIAFLDRAVPDICGYLKQAELPVEPCYVEACQGYHPQAFLCRPNATIYVQDAIRPYPFEGAMALHHSLVDVYQELGFDVVEVPFMEVEARAQFILKYLNIQ